MFNDDFLHAGHRDMQQQAQGQIFLHHREGEVLQRSQENGGYPEPFDGKNDQNMIIQMTSLRPSPGIMVNKGKHPQKALFQVSEIL